MLAAYLLLVGLPLLGLLGILEAGRGIPAPLSVSGDWVVALDSTVDAAKDATSPCAPPQTLNISQSGPQATVTWNDGHTAPQGATIDGSTLTAKSFTAAITGKGTDRRLAGTMNFPGCASLAFHATRQAPRKGGS